MTPDELPADMEARLEAFIRWLLPDNREPFSGSSLQVVEDLRAILKAYQEQRRALELFRRPHWIDDEAIDDSDEDAVFDLTVTVGEFRRIRAALNQKGDER